MRLLFLSALFISLLLSGACSTLPEVTPEERHDMQNYLFESARYDVIFQAVETVLRDDGYTIKVRDPGGGLIVAAVEKTGKVSAFFAAFKEDGGAARGQGYELSINLEQVNAFSVKARTTIQRIEHFALGAQQGEEVLEPAVYRNFYDMIRVEVGRASRGGFGKPPVEGFPVKIKPKSG